MKDELSNYIFGINPVEEALEEGRSPEKIYIQKGLQGPQYKQLFKKVRDLNIPFQIVPVERLNRITRKNHQGFIAQIAPIEYQKISDVLPGIYETGETPLFVILDRITDVRNFGAIARSAECAGAHALIIGAKDSAPVNAIAVKTSAGALSRMPVCRETELLEAITFLKYSGVQIVSCTEKSSDTIYNTDLTKPMAIAMGSEEKGISKAVLSLSDRRAGIPLQGKISSLNVSVATGIVLFETLRQRNIQ